MLILLLGPLIQIATTSPVWATINKPCSIALKKGLQNQTILFSNLEKLRIIRPLALSGVSENSSFLLRHSLTPFARAYPEYQKLSDILISKKADYHTLVKQLNSWLKAQNTGFQLALENDILDLYESLSSEDDEQYFNTWIPPVNRSNGYIAPDFYPYIVRAKLFPVADPHDLLAHFPTLVMPDFIENYKVQADLTIDIHRRRNDLFQRDMTDGYYRDLSLIEHLMMKLLRDATHENLNFVLVKPAGKKTFILQGNTALRIAHQFTSSRSLNLYELANTLLFGGNVHGTEIFPPTLSEYHQYLKIKGTGLFARNQELQKKLAIQSQELLTFARSRLLKALKLTLQRTKSIHGPFNPADINHEGMFFNVLGEEVWNDPLLKNIFSRELRAEFWENTLQLYKEYLDSARQNMISIGQL